MKIFLVGLPGSGKSTSGRQLSSLMSLEFLDLDQQIEQLTQMPISEVFQKYGETHFRELERDTLNKLSHERQQFVLATGGGTPCFHQNMETMNQAGITIFLDIPSREIIGRMSKKGIENRPLFRSLNPDNMVAEFDRKFSHRIPFYQQAKIEISGDTVTAERIAHLIALHNEETSTDQDLRQDADS